MKNASKATLILLVPMVLMIVVLSITILTIFRSTADHRLNHIRHQQEAAINERIKGQVDFALTLVEQMAILHADRDLAILQGEILDTLRRMRFGAENLDYIWIHTFDPTEISRTTMVMHPTLPELENQSLADHIDLEQCNRIYHRGNIYSTDSDQVAHIRPVNTFVRMNQICLESGSGFLSYYWPKPTLNGASVAGYEKQSYFTYYEPWNWVIGTGAYVDNIDTLVLAEQKIARNNENQLVFVFFVALLGAGVLGILGTWWAISKLSHAYLKLEEQLARNDQISFVLSERNSELETAMEELNTLSGLLPICSYCKKIRDDDGNWSQLESYISHRSDAEFSHSICPSCIEKEYPEMAE